MDRIPSRDNKRVMHHLLQEIEMYRTIFSMKVELVPRTRKGEPEAVIYVGSRDPVKGYSNIVTELKAAVSRISAVSGGSDPVNEFFQSAIHKKDAEEQGMHSGRNDNELANAFTRETMAREKRRPQKGVSRNKNGEPPAAERPASRGREQQSGGDDSSSSGSLHQGDIMSARKIMASASSDIQDNSDMASLASDPIDAKYWSNQFVTSGI